MILQWANWRHFALLTPDDYHDKASMSSGGPLMTSIMNIHDGRH